MATPLRNLKGLVLKRGPWLARQYPQATSHIVGLAVVYFWPELKGKDKRVRGHSRRLICDIVSRESISWWLAYVLVRIVVRWLINQSSTRPIARIIRDSRRR